MRGEGLHIFSNDPYAELIPYLHEPSDELKAAPRRAMIVCPGGGYVFLSRREDEPVALAWMAEGFQVFVLHYGICDRAKNYAPLVQACTAVRYVREHAKEWNIDPEHVFITGFSAGGHLAASAGTLWDHEAVREAFGDVPTRMGRPDGTVPCYPVITSGEYAHRGSMTTLAPEGASIEEQAAFSLERFVDEQTSPAFLWHTADDDGVPVQNSLLYASALAAHGVPFELHVFPHGAHGLSLCDERTWSTNPKFINPTAAAWFSLAVRWAKSI